jgi:hypothetical protein
MIPPPLLATAFGYRASCQTQDAINAPNKKT